MNLNRYDGFALMLALCLLGGLGLSPSWAEDKDHEQHGAHEHGAAGLNLVVEGNELHIEIRTPSVNVVGFEHQPNTAEQKATAKQAVQTWEDATQIFGLPSAANCRLQEVEVEAFVAEGENDEEHGKDEHADEHEEEHGKDEHADEHEEEEMMTHSEFHIAYQFSCDSPDRLKSVELHIFKRFPGFEELDAQVITPNGQTAQELTKTQSVIAL